jgi:hypothetical protein
MALIWSCVCHEIRLWPTGVDVGADEPLMTAELQTVLYEGAVLY